MVKSNAISHAYKVGKEQFAALGVDTDKALDILDQVPISLPCWQSDDVTGFENTETALTGGIQATGNYLGKARNIDEVRDDMQKVFSLIPGRHRLNLHAIYGDFSNGKTERNQIDNKHFQSWVDWARAMGIGLDFNSTLFSHAKAESGYTLSNNDPAIRNFWIEHVCKCRDISAYIGKGLGSRCIHNIWIPDGSKDLTVSRFEHRVYLKESLDKIFKKEYDPSLMADTLESKLFGIGLESFTVGSHEFYLGYAVENKIMLCLDIGHFHPTEQVSDKVSAIFPFIPELLLHITRPVRWDSDHVVTLNDEVRALFEEIIWADKLDEVNTGLDFFDGSINRIGAYVIGTRAVQKAIMQALLSPVKQLKEYERNGQNFERLALLEEMKTKPFGAVWDYFCLINDVPVAENYITEIQKYEKEVLRNREQ
jgi:L-rhamnose isomerase